MSTDNREEGTTDMAPLPFHPATRDGLSQPVWRPRVVGLDLSLTSTGMSDGQTHYATQTTPDQCDEERLNDIILSVRHFLDCAGGWDQYPNLVVIESSAYTSNHQKGHEELATIRRMARRDCWLRGIPFALVSPTTLKLYTTGSGMATKPEMLAALIRDAVGTAEELPGVKVKDGRYDMADALALAAMGYAHIHRLNEPEAHYRPALDTVKWPHLTCT